MTFSNTSHTVKRFDVEIQQLINLVMAMGREVEQQFQRAEDLCVVAQRILSLER